MRYKSLRVCVALATFFAGLGLVRRGVAPRPPRRMTVPQAGPRAPAPPEAPALQFPPPVVVSEATEAPLRVGQQELVTIRGVGKVKVTAYEPVEEAKPTTLGGYPSLVFTDAATGKELADVWFNWEGEATNVQVRFKVIHVKGLPDPLVVGIALTPGGSDSCWEAIPVGAVNGELRELTREMLTTANQGGFFFGDLGNGAGPGAAAWTFIWDEGESHYQAHQYEMKLYRWDPRRQRFEWHKVLRTSSATYPAKNAPRLLGLRFRDIREKFPDFANVEEW